MFDAGRVLAPRPARAPRGAMPIGIAGLFSTASGVGEGARLAYAALEAAGLAPAAFISARRSARSSFRPVPPCAASRPGRGA